MRVMYFFRIALAMKGVDSTMKRSISVISAVVLLFCLLPGAKASDKGRHNWYEVFVRSYQDSNADGIGDLNGLISRLDYISDMGYNGLWLMPIMPSPSYHKYDVTDYCAVDPEYGDLDDMRELVKQAHQRGISLIIDLPVNHTSTEHPWFKNAADALRTGTDSPYISYYNFSAKPEQGYVPLGDTGWYYEERFAGGGMPDLALDSPDVRREISGITAFWLKEIGVDGFRLDAVTSYYTGQRDKNIAFLRDLKTMCDQAAPDCYLVGECWAGLSEISAYYESGIDSFFLFPASQAEGFVVASLRGRSAHAERFARQYANVLDSIKDGALAPFLANHDTGRTIGSVQGRKNLAIAKFAHGVVNMLGGNVFTYYGDEIGMVGSGDDPNKRLAMFWNENDMTEQPPGVTRLEYAYPSVDDQLKDENSLLNYMKALNHARLAHPLIAEGDNGFVYVSGDVCLMSREGPAGINYIAMNFSSSADGTCEVPENLKITRDLETGEGKAALDGTKLTLPPYAIVILEAAAGGA